MNGDNNQSRSNKFEKRRKNTKKLSILMIIASILIVILLAIWIFGGKDNDASSPENNSLENGNIETGDDLDSEDQSNEDTENSITDEKLEITENEELDNEENTNEEMENANEENIEVETEQVDPSDDNVIEAYTGDWQPIGTEQEGPHTTNYDDGSDDRIEIKRAVMSVTDLGDDMIEWRIGNGGDQKVIATVSNPEQTDIYRVLLSWIDNQGWQVTKVEKLQEVQY